MSVVVVNQLTLSVSPAELRAAIEREFPPAGQDRKVGPVLVDHAAEFRLSHVWVQVDR